MIISNFARTDLTASIYHGLLDAPEWAGFVKLLRSDSGADMAILLQQRADGEIAILRSARVTGKATQQHIARFAHDERVPFTALRAERVYAFSEFSSELAAVHKASQPILPDALASGRVVHVSAPPDHKAWIVIARERGDFSAAEAAQLSTAAAHFKIALQIHVEHMRARARIRMTRPATKGLDFAWIALDDSGRILDSNARAQAMLAAQNIVRRGQGNRLLFAARAANSRLAKHLAETAAGHTFAPTSLHISDTPRIDLLLMSPSRAQRAGIPTAAVIAYLHGDQRESAARQKQISELFALAPQEARLALALSRGRSITQSAQDLNISVHTARLYSKRIYAKTGTKGQADLVRLLLSSLLALEQ